MKTLQQICEGLLDSDLDSNIDKTLDSKVAEVLMSELKKIKWDPQYEESSSGSRIYKVKDLDKALKILLQTVKKVIKYGQDCKYSAKTPFSKIPDSFIISVMEDKQWPYIAFINPHLPDIYYITRHYYCEEAVVYQTSMDDRAAKESQIRHTLRTHVNNCGMGNRDPYARRIDILIPLPLWDTIKNTILP